MVIAFALLLTLGLTPKPLEQVSLDLGDTTIQFPVDNETVPECQTMPGATKIIAEMLPKSARVQECFFSAIDLRHIREQGALPVDHQFMFVATLVGRDERPYSEPQWKKIKLDVLKGMPPLGTHKGENSSSTGAVRSDGAKGSSDAEASTEHVYREAPWGIFVEEDKDGKPHVSELAFVLLSNRVVYVAEDFGYSSGSWEEARLLARKRLDAIVDHAIALNPSVPSGSNALELKAALPADKSDAMKACVTNSDDKAKIAACSAAILAGGLSDAGISDAYDSRARAYRRMKDYPSALADLEFLIQHQPENATALGERGMIRQIQGDFVSAIADLEKSIRLGGGSFWEFGNLGKAYQDKHDFDRAEANFGHAIELNKKSATGWASRCFVRAVSGKDFDGALADCNEALKRAPTEPGSFAPVTNYRCFAYYRMKRYREAVRDCDAAIAKGATFASAFYVRGLAKRAIGDASASDDIDHAKKINPKIAEEYVVYGAPERP